MDMSVCSSLAGSLNLCFRREHKQELHRACSGVLY